MIEYQNQEYVPVYVPSYKKRTVRSIEHRLDGRMNYRKFVFFLHSLFVYLDTCELQDDTDSICVVCHDEYKCREHVRVLNCGHTFHKKCIDKWLCYMETCPLCRRIVV